LQVVVVLAEVAVVLEVFVNLLISRLQHNSIQFKLVLVGPEVIVIMVLQRKAMILGSRIRAEQNFLNHLVVEHKTNSH
jgi:hypothetical protein